MKDFESLPDDLQALARETDTLRRMMPRIIGVEGVKFVRGNFDAEGFREASLQVWAKRKHESSRSSGKQVLSDRKHLKDGVRYEASGLDVIIGIDGAKLPYGKLHNEGGEITPKDEQRSYFWYRYKQAKQVVDKDNARKAIGGNKSKKTSKRVSAASDEADFWKGMALAKKLKFPKRKFLGESPVFWEAVKTEVKDRLDNIFKKYNLL